MKRFLKYIALLLFVFLIVANLLSIGSLWSLRKSDFYKPSFLVNGVSEDNFDYIILGSSVGLTTLDTAIMDSINHTVGINLSVDDTGMSGQYLMLQHFLAEGKKTGYCVLAPGIAALENKRAVFGNNDYRFLMYVNRDYVYDYYKNAAHGSSAARVAALSRWFPFVGVSYYNTELFFPSIYSLFSPNKRNRFDVRGNYAYPERNKTFKNMPLKTETVAFEHPYLKKIETLCKENNIKLVYYFSPMRTERIDYAEPGFMVIDDSGALTDDVFFYDDIHVNFMGRRKISKSFADRFRQMEKER